MAAFDSGVPPAAVIVESVQCEGGVHVASKEWLRTLRRLCSEFGTVLIIDEVQSGIGRTGKMLGFEHAGIEPDIIAVSKSLSGMGLPLSLILVRQDLDQWSPGEHTGTFRGLNLAFVTASECLQQIDNLLPEVNRKGALVQKFLVDMLCSLENQELELRGVGMLWGIDFSSRSVVEDIVQTAFNNQLILETCGPHGNVLKLLPPLNTSDETLEEGLEILANSINTVLRRCAS